MSSDVYCLMQQKNQNLKSEQDENLRIDSWPDSLWYIYQMFLLKKKTRSQYRSRQSENSSLMFAVSSLTHPSQVMKCWSVTSRQKMTYLMRACIFSTVTTYHFIFSTIFILLSFKIHLFHEGWVKEKFKIREIVHKKIQDSYSCEGNFHSGYDQDENLTLSAEGSKWFELLP